MTNNLIMNAADIPTSRAEHVKRRKPISYSQLFIFLS